MRLRSTGLGKTELEAKIVDVKRVDNVVIFFADVIKPVKWRTRMAFQERDLRMLVGAMLRPKNLWYVIRALLFSKKKVQRTENF